MTPLLLFHRHADDKKNHTQEEECLQLERQFVEKIYEDVDR